MALIEKNKPSDGSSFEERMRQAEQEAGVPPDEEVYADFGQYPEPDETGRVPTSREPVEVEAEAEVAETPEAEAEPEAEQEVEPETAESPDTQAGEPEPELDVVAELADLKKKYGQLLNENGEMRRDLAERPDPAEQMQEWLAAAQAQQQGALSPDQFEQLLDADPATATMLAHQRGDQIGYARAWQAWNDVAPGAPQIWADNQQLRHQLDEFQKTVGQQIAPAREAAAAREMEVAMSAVAARHDDYAEVMGSLNTPDGVTNIMSSGLPIQFLEQGLAGGREDKEKVFETLYRWLKADRADHLIQAASQAPAQAAEEARQEKIAAHVGSAATTTPEPVQETEGERQQRVWAEQFPTLRGAWKGQDSRR